MTAPPRHALLRIDAAAWGNVLAERHDLLNEPLLRDWAPQWPVIARRRAPDDRPGTPVGVPLPPAHGKRRVALVLNSGVAYAVEPPPLLAAIHASAPEVWKQTIAAVLSLAASVSVAPRVYGSFAWGAITGLDYVGPFSDLDLLWAIAPDTDVAALLAGLSQIDADTPARLDGELIAGAAAMAVNWRELHRGGDVLVKTSGAVALQTAAWFLQAREA